jgi:hypothetical protein
MRKLTPISIRTANEVKKIAAIAVGNRSQDPLAVVARLERNLGYAWEIFAYLIAVIC